MSIQSEAALEAGLIATLMQMDYEYVQIAEEDNPKSVIRISLCRTAKRNPLIFPI